ncbi:MAG: hypothetical protein NXI31_22820 [bacterium]|nr:hypothetical protein [bacterium]
MHVRGLGEPLAEAGGPAELLAGEHLTQESRGSGRSATTPSNLESNLDTYDFLADPRSLPLAGRKACAERLADDQNHWLSRLEKLVEGPAPDSDFPAFLLATPAFESLGSRIAGAHRRADLATEVADELDWFIDKFADYLRTDADEDVFAPASVMQSLDNGQVTDRAAAPRRC